MEDFGLKEFPSNEELASIKEIYSDLDEYSVLIILRYISISKEITKSYNYFFNMYGLTDAKFSVLMILYRAPNRTLFPYEIAEQSGITRASVTTLLDGLSRKKLITRQHDVVDRRKIVVTLTNEGLDCLKEILPIHYRLTQNITSFLSIEQKRTFLKFLTKLELGLEKYKTEVANRINKKKEEKNE
ncbi:MarR family winged helix-turn-helix transcriptional regulator [Streptococcus sp. H49]|uniref:MarR family winged helix-turn-helix transcriptional regulator n=1 Tax=Streptococcus huangxiaojuni TaxID=3237239 RepID=UPI0034A53005